MIKGVDSKKWIRISKIAVLLEVCCGLSAEVAGACISTGILNLVFKKKNCVLKNNHLALTISSEGRTYNEKSTEDGDMRVAVCLEVLRLPVSLTGRSRARTEGIVTMRNLSLQPFTKPSMPGLTFPAPINDDVEGWQLNKFWMEVKSSKCWPQEYGPGVAGWNRRRAYLGALWLFATGDEPILGYGSPCPINDDVEGWQQEYGPGVHGWKRRRAYLEALWLFAVGDEPILGYGSPFWTKAGLSYAMAILDMIERWTNERNDDGACIIGTRLAACFWIHTKAVEIVIKAFFWGEKEK